MPLFSARLCLWRHVLLLGSRLRLLPHLGTLRSAAELLLLGLRLGLRLRLRLGLCRSPALPSSATKVFLPLRLWLGLCLRLRLGLWLRLYAMALPPCTQTTRHLRLRLCCWRCLLLLPSPAAVVLTSRRRLLRLNLRLLRLRLRRSYLLPPLPAIGRTPLLRHHATLRIRLDLRLYRLLFSPPPSTTVLPISFASVITATECRLWQRSRHLVIRYHRPRRNCHSRTPMVVAIKLLPVLHRLLAQLSLRRQWSVPPLVHHSDLCRSRPHRYATRPIEAWPPREPDLVYVVVVNAYNDSRINVVALAVVIEVTATPVAAVVAIAGVPIAIVDSTVEADVQPPESMVEAISSAVEDPVSRCPQCAHIRRLNPGPGHPVISIRRPGPVTRRPDVIRIRRWRLVVIRQWRRRLVRLFV